MKSNEEGLLGASKVTTIYAKAILVLFDTCFGSFYSQTSTLNDSLMKQLLQKYILKAHSNNVRSPTSRAFTY